MTTPGDNAVFRSFDPVAVGRAECDAWAAYYRHEWGRFLRAALEMVHAGFAMSWPRTLQGAALVLRANQVWAPVPDNDPAAARRLMSSFYRLVINYHSLSFDPDKAAELEVEWWRAHRDNQRGPQPGAGEAELVQALVALYSYVYGVDEMSVRSAAVHRMVAMRLSDQWVAEGLDLADPVLGEERRELVRSYTDLHDAVSAWRSSPR